MKLIYRTAPPLACVLFTSACWSLAQRGDEAGIELASGDLVQAVELRKADEIVVEKDGQRATVRLLGVVSFDEEINDPAAARWRAAARAFLEVSLLRKEATLTLGPAPNDQSGRFLGNLAVGGSDVGRSLIEQGLGVVYTEYAFEREAEYLRAEAEARQAGKGLWGDEKSARLIGKLREQWAQFRKKRSGEEVTDPLLVPANEDAGTAVHRPQEVQPHHHQGAPAP